MVQRESAKIPGERALRWSVASLWLATGVAVLHPHYRTIGESYLDRLGLPHGLMWATCAAEVALAVLLIARPMGARLAGLQIALIAGFTVILAALEPALMAHPFGLLTKNLPTLAAIAVCWRLARGGWDPTAIRWLRWGMAVIWFTEGLFPKILFQQPMEVAVVANSGLVPWDPSAFLAFMGGAQVASAFGALALRGRWRDALLTAQCAALVALPLMVSWQDPLLWVHPFGPMTKNVPILVGTWLLARRCWR